MLASRRPSLTTFAPQGFIAAAVEGKDGGAMFRQVMASSALVLLAEAASHVGVDLWSHAVRGVSVVTTAIYPIYYFYTTAQWKWDADYPVEEGQALFARRGGYLEMVQRRAPMRDLQMVLEDLRPLYDPRGGGLTTLTHAASEKKRRGLFG